MAFFHIQMESKALHMPVPLDVILPQPVPGGHQGPYKSLYLLHGSSECQSAWILNSCLYRYVNCWQQQHVCQYLRWTGLHRFSVLGAAFCL